MRKKERFVLGKRTFRSQKSKHFVLRIIEAMKAIDINEKAAKEASKEKSSFSGIVYIDGMESSKERMDNLNPDRIASMNVYKGNEAIAKFGEKGRNGVIEIKLKK